jgi:hypothetical protein
MICHNEKSRYNEMDMRGEEGKRNLFPLDLEVGGYLQPSRKRERERESTMTTQAPT